jgi:hypothetical protein
MWTTLIGLIERWWREKPRLDIVRAVVQLRDAMEACESSYEAYRKAKLKGSKLRKSELQELRAVWDRNVRTLTVQVVALDTVLQIFGPNLHREIMDYSGDETDTLADDALYTMAKEMKQEPEIDVNRVVLTDKYRSALSELDAFIRANFKPEEVLAVKSSRLR